MEYVHDQATIIEDGSIVELMSNVDITTEDKSTINYLNKHSTFIVF